jgi:hypothetical protein
MAAPSAGCGVTPSRVTVQSLHLTTALPEDERSAVEALEHHL